MLDTLQKMSGTTHVSYTDSKTVTRDAEKIMLQNEGKVSYNMTTKEVPVISYNDLAFISERNSIVFRAGDSPIWNRNETILPMSWRLFKNTIIKPGKEFTLQTIPTLSSAMDFDVRKNQPDFRAMLNKRRKQAEVSKECQDIYQEAYGYKDDDVARLDPDEYSDEIMDMINRKIECNDIDENNNYEHEPVEDAAIDDYDDDEEYDNTEQFEANAIEENKQAQRTKKIYAGGKLSKDDLVSQTGIKHQFDKEISAAYNNCKSDMCRDNDYFRADGCSLYNVETGELYIEAKDYTDDLKSLESAGNDSESRVYNENGEAVDSSEMNVQGSYIIKDSFYKFLVSLPSWDFANGRFEEEMKKQINI